MESAHYHLRLHCGTCCGTVRVDSESTNKNYEKYQYRLFRFYSGCKYGGDDGMLQYTAEVYDSTAKTECSTRYCMCDDRGSCLDKQGNLSTFRDP